MIQRIQTVYLLLVTILVGITLFAPLAWFDIGGVLYSLKAFGVEATSGESIQTPVYWAGILLALSSLLPLVTIFLFKHRLLQIRLCVVEGVLLLGCIVMLAVAYFGHGEVMAQGLKPAIALPLVSIVFVWLAGRAIFKDELLVKSLDRVR